MEQNIVLTTELQEKFKTAWGQRQVILFTAPCGCGKSAAASALLEPYTVCRWDALSESLEPAPDFTCDAVLLDNVQALKNLDAQQALHALIMERPETHFILLSRGAVPGWLASFRYERRMQVLEAQDLLLDQETAEILLARSGVSPTPAEMAAIQKSSKGYPLALGILCHQMQGGRPYDETVDADVRRELFTHFQTAVYRRFKPMTRRLLLDLAPFEPFDVEFARILSGNSRAGELLGELQQDTSMFRYDDLHRCHFWPVFRQFLLWQQEREYSAEEQNWLYGRAALYYELHDNYKNSLDCYTRCGEYQKVSELLIKNSELHPGLAHYDEMEDYYRALPREQVLSSPALMAGMSMLSSICMDYDASEAWYLELERCAGRLKRSDADYKSVRGWLAYLDIALPQRSVGDILSKLTNVVSLLSSKEIVMPEFSVTSRLPSIMNGGKDFCAWSREDDDLYRKYRIPVSFLLKRDGVALPECAIAESKFEKGEEISGRMLDLLGRLEKIQKKGTPDIEFALIGLLVRLRIDQGEADRAIEHLEALRERFQRPDCQRFLPNLDALMCRIAMYQGNDEAVDTWYREKAPRDLLKLRVMLRYQYLTRAMVEIVYGKYQEALLVMAPLRPYIVDNVTDRLAFGAAFAGVQRHDACGCHDGILLSELVSFIAINPFGGYNKIKIFLHLKGVPFMIEKWIAEATECDFKVAVEIKKPKSWLKSVSAFSNGIGGTLFFGIDDNQNTVGLPDIQGDAEAISRFIKERITPIPQFVLTPFQEDGKDMLALKIPAGTSTPYYYKADGIMEAYIRVGNESVAAPDYIVNELILKGTHRSFDALVTDAPRKDYSFTLLEATYLERTGLRMELPDYCSFGLADKNGMLTNAGRLLTDQRTVFNSRIFCTRWNGLEKGSIFDDALDDKEYEGSLIYLLQSGCEFIRNNSKVRFAKEAQYRVDKPDYAERAVTEAVVNALIHRDYIVLGSEIHIDMYDDRVEIVSPGGMFEGAPVQECDINTIRSVRRNPVIADLFHRMKYMERRGSGLRKIVTLNEQNQKMHKAVLKQRMAADKGSRVS